MSMKTILTFSFLFSFFISYSQTVSIPDPNFEQRLIDAGIDSDGVINGQVLESDVASLSTLIISGTGLPDIQKISDLTGIEAFVSLRVLRCDNNLITQLDLSNNPILEELRCFNNSINSLNVSNNGDLNYLDCQNNVLRSLDVSNNFNLITIRCQSNQITTLDVSGINVLNELSANSNNLQLNLDLSNNPSLTTMSTTSNPDLLCIQVANSSDAAAGAGIYSTWTKDAAASYSQNCEALFPTTLIPDAGFEQALIVLGYDNAQDGRVLTANISGITTLDVSVNNINDLTGIEDFAGLQNLDVSNNNLTSLNLSQNTNLASVIANGNNLTSLNLGNNTNLNNLNVSNNNLSSISLSSLTGLITLNINDNSNLGSFDVSQNTLLEELQCNNTNLTTINLSQNSNLTYLSCASNQLSNLDLTAQNSLETLLCNNNDLTSLDLRGKSSLTTMNATGNSSLSCILVDDANAANAGTGIYASWLKDTTTRYSLTCNPNTAPTAVCQAITVDVDNSCQVTVQASSLDGGSTDPEGDQLFFSLANNVFSNGVHQVTLTVSDGDLSDQCNTTITANDVTKPVPDVASLPTVNTDCAISVTPPTATDNCAGTVTATTNDPSSFNSPGSYTINWTYDDGSGNTETQTQTVIVADNTPPTAICQNLDIPVDANGKAVVKAEDLANGSFDNCGPVQFEFADGSTELNIMCAASGISLYFEEIIVKDNNGNQSSCFSLIRPADNIPPTAKCKDVTIELNAGGGASYTERSVDDGSFDNCSLADVVFIDEPLGCFNIGTFEVTNTLVDNGGNQSSCKGNITVVDLIGPDAQCKDVFVVLDANGQGTITAQEIDNGSSDACGIQSMSLNKTTVTCADHSVILTVTDVNNNSSTCTANLSYDDITPPVPDVANLPTITLDCSASVTPPTATDICAGAVTGTTNDPTSFNSTGNYTINWTYDDGNGNSSNQSQNVVVVDNTPPTAICKQTFTVQLDANGEAKLSAQELDNGSTDNCGSLTFEFTDGSTEIIYNCLSGARDQDVIVKDNSGNTSFCGTTVFIEDNTIPKPICKITYNVQLDENGDAKLTAQELDDGSTDNCDLTFEFPDGSTEIIYNCLTGAYVQDVRVKDRSGNFDFCATEVRVQDNISPNAKCKLTYAVQLDENGDAKIMAQELDDGSTDNCGSLTFEFFDGSTEKIFDCSQGSIDQDVIVKDNSGNTSLCSSTIYIEENIPPTAKCKTTYVVQLGANGEAILKAQELDNGSTDNCGSLIFEFPGGLTEKLFNCSSGAIDQDVIVKDNSGNTSFCGTTVYIQDNIPPVAKCKDITIYRNAGGSASFNLSQLNDGSSDNCGLKPIIGLGSAICGSVSQFPVTMTIEDLSGNRSSCSGQVMVVDPIPPTARCKDVNVLLDENGQATISIGQVNNGSTDNCFIVGGELDKTIVTCTDKTVTLTIRDSDGNENSCTANLTYDEKVAPVPDVVPLPTINADCSTTVTAPTATDNCAGTLTGTTNDPTSFNAPGNYTINWTYDDGNGNSSTQAQTVIVSDNTPPTAICQNISVPVDANGNATIKPQDLDNGSSDNCGTVLFEFSDGSTEMNVQCPSQPGPVPRISIIVKDGNGNQSTCSGFVSTTDNIPPVAECQDITIELDADGKASFTITDIDKESYDNCGFKPTGYPQVTLTCSNIGTTTRTYTVEDYSGNQNSCKGKVTVVDRIAPIPDVTNLPDINGICSASVSTAPTATDNCGGVITGTTSDPLTYSTQGTHIITWTFDDGNGNSVTQTQTVIIKDGSNPIPDVTTLPTITAECSVTVPAPTATDNCGGTITATTSDPTSYSTQGSYTITWTYDDGNGNSVSQMQNVVIKDVTAPVPDVASLPTIQGNCEVGIEPPFATDNCAGQITGTTSDPLYYDQKGTYTVTWIFDDGNGNTSSQDQTIMIGNAIAPVPDRASLPTLRGQCSVSVSTVPTATDACNGTIQGTSSDPLSYTTQGVHIITWTFDDGNGNIATQTQRVVVRDRQAPVPDQANLPTLRGSCSVMITNFPTATDNCAGSITATTNSPLEYDQDGNYSIVWNYDDGNGNTSSQTQWVVINSGAAPNALCKNISVPLGSAESVSIKAEDINNGSFDDCSNVSLLVGAQGGLIFGNVPPPAPSIDLYCNKGKVQTLILYVTNEEGETANCQATVTLEGDDTDNDGLLDSCDNCPDTYNPNQQDSNNNGIGDACEEDTNPNPDPDPNPGGWEGWSLKKQGKEDNKVITELKAFPNPFQEEINLSFNLNQEERTTIEVFNIQGQRVHTLLSEVAPKGEHRVLWDGKDQNGQSMPAGIYLVRLRAGKALINQKVVLQK